MTTIKFNNLEYEVTNYNKNTYFSNNVMNSSATCGIKAANLSALNALAEEKTPITSIIIKYNNDVIYTLENINAKIESINEYLSMDHIDYNVNLIFDNTVEDVI